MGCGRWWRRCGDRPRRRAGAEKKLRLRWRAPSQAAERTLRTEARKLNGVNLA